MGDKLTNESLVEKMVVLDTAIYYDSANQCGVIGKVVSADIDADRFYVEVGKKEPRLFASDCLMVLKDQPEICDYLTTNMKSLAKSTLKDLYSICFLMDSLLPEHQLQALAIASSKRYIGEVALITLEDRLKQENEVVLNEGPERRIGRGR